MRKSTHLSISLMIALASVMSIPTAPALDNNKASDQASTSTSKAADAIGDQIDHRGPGDKIKNESEIVGDIATGATQEIELENGVNVTLFVNEAADLVSIKADNGEEYEFKLSELRAYAEQPEYERELKKPNKCQVASGVAGVAHSALWGAVHPAAGVAAAAYWWGIGTQC